MGKKIFISYKYADNDVLHLARCGFTRTTVRDYVDEIQDTLDESDHINKGENDGEDMGSLADSTISSKLGDKIYDSTVTIILISKNMKEAYIPEEDQWIPWEISYSLKEQSRNGQKSKTNAIIAVILPDSENRYDYYIIPNTNCNCTHYKTDQLFEIIRNNMFNLKNPDSYECEGTIVYTGNHSYIYNVRWDEFISDMDIHIEHALTRFRNRENYNIQKKIKVL